MMELFEAFVVCARSRSVYHEIDRAFGCRWVRREMGSGASLSGSEELEKKRLEGNGLNLRVNRRGNLKSASSYQNQKEILQSIRSSKTPGQNSCGDNSFDSAISSGRVGLGEKLDLRTVVGKIREQFPKFSTSDRLWWQGLARILEERGCIKEGDDLGRVCIKHPELTELGLKFLHSETMQDFYAYPEADMLLSVRNQKSFSTFSEWGKGWADPKIRRERLQRKKSRRKTRKKNQDWTTVRGSLAGKLSRQK